LQLTGTAQIETIASVTECETTDTRCPIRTYDMKRYFFDFATTFFIIIFIGEIFAGVIIDTFKESRETKDLLTED